MSDFSVHEHVPTWIMALLYRLQTGRATGSTKWCLQSIATTRISPCTRAFQKLDNGVVIIGIKLSVKRFLFD
jgi:hypothetical protein